MTLTLSTEKVGTRVYVIGNTYAVKDALKAAGCHFDFERKQWWIGAVKAEKIATIVRGLDGKKAPKADLGKSRVYGKVEYKYLTYYVVATTNSPGETRLRLTVLDGSIDFWASSTDCKWVKTYESRFVYGREVHQTLDGIRRFIAQQKNPATAKMQCVECGSYHDQNERCPNCGGC